jgi:periplasmic copper chaperone A
MIRRALMLALLLLAPILAHAQDSPIVVHDVMARPTLAGAPNGIAFMVIENHGSAADRLTGAATPVAGKAQVHEMSMTGNVMRMRAAGPVTVPAGGRVTLDPDGLHLMMMGMKQRLKAGDTFPITLQFEKAGEITVTATVAAAQ